MTPLCCPNEWAAVSQMAFWRHSFPSSPELEVNTDSHFKFEQKKIRFPFTCPFCFPSFWRIAVATWSNFAVASEVFEFSPFPCRRFSFVSLRISSDQSTSALKLFWTCSLHPQYCLSNWNWARFRSLTHSSGERHQTVWMQVVVLFYVSFLHSFRARWSKRTEFSLRFFTLDWKTYVWKW